MNRSTPDGLGTEFEPLQRALAALVNRYNPSGENLHFTELEIDRAFFGDVSRLTADGLDVLKRHDSYFMSTSIYEPGFWYELFLVVSRGALSPEAASLAAHDDTSAIARILVEVSRYTQQLPGNDIWKRNREALGNLILGLGDEHLISAIRAQASLMGEQTIAFVESTFEAVAQARQHFQPPPSAREHFVCPKCGKEAKTQRGLARHLMGTTPYGGHELSASEAVRVAAEAASVPSTPDADSDSDISALPARERAGFLFEMLARLVDNKRLPKYQFERAIDGFLGAFLPGILESVAGGAIGLITQEFPLKKEKGNQTTNVDYVLFRNGPGPDEAAWMFVELKTDARSVSIEQQQRYMDVVGPPTTMKYLLEAVQEVREASALPEKYDELISRFDDLPLDREIELVYLSPRRHSASGFRGRFYSITFEDLSNLELKDYAGEWDLFRELALPALIS